MIARQGGNSHHVRAKGRASLCFVCWIVALVFVIFSGAQPAWANVIVSLDGSDGGGSSFGGAQEFALNGNHIRDFNFFNAFHPNDRPRFQDVELGPDGQVYIVSRRFNSVYRLDYASGDMLDKPGGFLSAPLFAEFRPNGNLLVSSEGNGHGVQEMQDNGGTPWASSQFSITATHRRGVSLGPDGKYYVGVLGGTVERYNSDGTHDAAYSIVGNSTFMGDIEFVGDDLLVAQQSSTVIKVFDRDSGAAGTDIPAGGSLLWRANDMLLLPDGRLLVANNSANPIDPNEVLEFDSATGNYLGVFASFPAGVIPRGLAFVVPEPSTLVLIGPALIGILVRRRQRRIA